MYQLAWAICTKSSASSAGPGKLGRMKGILGIVEPPGSSFNMDVPGVARTADGGSSTEPDNVRIFIYAELKVRLQRVGTVSAAHFVAPSLASAPEAVTARTASCRT
ncbi:Uncharacterised protein [Mycobacterium tuberculosis]|uniref:Uncharacterized protein n=1 Tax=Mycobacterium tuberculosis TaxID=1773 RepID=A0A0T9FME4_MYCTX|nr:Uncharacterised protein [Mycobacterium tuberculosis]COW26600.1 Uncharacterised protein [Mycobacterium tuberculosis]COX05782.1 Uncharacterised protein [Mycobacterium tuberculosis]COZ15471.1 Uncharacterised protein [Mycobacterium tuberculosis]